MKNQVGEGEKAVSAVAEGEEARGRGESVFGAPRAVGPAEKKEPREGAAGEGGGAAPAGEPGPGSGVYWPGPAGRSWPRQAPPAPTPGPRP